MPHGVSLACEANRFREKDAGGNVPTLRARSGDLKKYGGMLLVKFVDRADISRFGGGRSASSVASRPLIQNLQ